MQIAEDLFWYSKDKPLTSFLFRGFSCNVYAINQGDEIWLIDTGVKAFGRAERIIKYMKKDGLDPKKIKKIFVTHAHADHINGIPVFKQKFNPTIYVHELDRLLFEGQCNQLIKDQTDISEKFGISGLMPAPPSIYRFGLHMTMGSMPVGIPADVLLHDGDIIKGSRYDLRVIHTPGHTPGHCVFYIPQNKVLFLGDLFDPYFEFKDSKKGLLVRVPLNLASSDFDQFYNSITKILPLDIQILLMMHEKRIRFGNRENHQLMIGALNALDYAKEITINILKKHGEKGARLKDLKGKYPKKIWWLTDQTCVPFGVLKSLIKQGMVVQNGDRFSYIGQK